MARKVTTAHTRERSPILLSCHGAAVSLTCLIREPRIEGPQNKATTNYRNDQGLLWKRYKTVAGTQCNPPAIDLAMGCAFGSRRAPRHS